MEKVKKIHKYILNTHIQDCYRSCIWVLELAFGVLISTTKISLSWARLFSGLSVGALRRSPTQAPDLYPHNLVGHSLLAPKLVKSKWLCVDVGLHHVLASNRNSVSLFWPGSGAVFKCIPSIYRNVQFTGFIPFTQIFMWRLIFWVCGYKA
jgi:hypothetical protein